MLDWPDVVKIIIAGGVTAAANLFLQNKATKNRDKNTILMSMNFIHSVIASDYEFFQRTIVAMKPRDIEKVPCPLTSLELTVVFSKCSDLFRLSPQLGNVVVTYLQLRKYWLANFPDGMTLDQLTDHSEMCFTCMISLEREIEFRATLAANSLLKRVHLCIKNVWQQVIPSWKK